MESGESPTRMPDQPTIGGASASSSAKRAANLATILEIGSKLGGRYEILEMLGLGGMGAVYKARDSFLDRLVALKVIRPDLSSDPEAVLRFKQETVLARQITHRNVVRVFDIGEADGVMYLTMEFVEGMDLRSIVGQKGKLPPREAVEIMWQVCNGLQTAHAEGVVHRDLKPGNIMRDGSGRILVMDFGLARTLQGDGMTKSGAMLGTMEYMSPEQARGSHVDARSDIYTVGLILYELLTGKMPFEAESAIASLVQRTQSNPKPISDFDQSIPRPVSDIVAKCLERDVEKRFQTVEELAGALDAFREHPSSSFSKESYLAAVAAKKWKRLAFGAVAAVVVVGLAVTAYLGLHKTPGTPVNHPPMTVLVGDFANRTGDPVFDGTVEPMLNVALEGSSFLNAYNRGAARRMAQGLPHPSEKLDEESARLVAISQGIGAVITGELTASGSKYDISARALDAVSGKVIAEAKVTAGSKDQVLSVIPKLAAPIREALGDTTPDSEQMAEEAGGFTAASIEVVHQYSKALDLQYAGKMDEALQTFQKAAALDPNFARAYAGMAAMAMNLGRRQDAEKYVNLAMQHVDRMTERERYRIRGMFFVASGDSRKCVDEYTELVKRYPADLSGHANLAGCLNYLRRVPEAIEQQKKAVEISPKSAALRLYLSFYSSYGGDFQGAEREAQEALKLAPSPDGYMALAEAQLGQGQLEQASESYQQVKKDNPSAALAGLADIAVYQGRYKEATQLLEQGIAADSLAKNSDGMANKYAALAHVQLLMGQSGAASASAEKALANSSGPNIQFLAGQVFTEAGQIEKAAKLASILSGELKAEPQAYGKILEGNIALKRGDPKAAIKAIIAANELLDTWIGRFSLGRAYFEAGMYVEADSEFDRCLKRNGEALELFMDNVPTYGYFPAVYYYEGRVHQQLKSSDAKDFFQRYLDIREKSGEDPIISDIKKRLSESVTPPVPPATPS